MNEHVQPRQLRGEPQGAGGQFKGRTYSEDDVRLDLSDTEYNQTGTFLFPPRPRSAQQHISFWENCPVGDDVLENLSLGYEKWAFEWHQVTQNEWLRSDGYKQLGIDRWNAEASLVDTAARTAIEKAAEAYSKDVLDKMHPRTISAFDARPVARAGQMYHYSGDLSNEEQLLVDNHPIELRKETLTAREVVNKYNLIQMRKFIMGSTRAIVESLDQVREEASERQ